MPLALLLLTGQQATLSQDYFASDVLPALEAAGCQNCHSANGVANTTRLRFPPPGTSKQDLLQFGKSLHVLINRADLDKSPLVQKPTRRLPHGGGLKLAPGSTGETALRNWSAYLARHTKPDEKFPLSAQMAQNKPVLRRLTHTQYNNTVRDLLGDDSRLAAQFPPEDFTGGYRNQFASQSISPLLAEAYSAAAEKLAAAAFRNGDHRKLLPCQAHTPTCHATFLKQFGLRAFRRPLTPGELARYQKLMASQPTLLSGAQLVLEAMLQSPNFLLRVENGADAANRPFEIASRLSYALWNSMPDATLLQAAGSGKLQTPEELEAHARRLLDDPRAKASLDEFVAEWLRFDQLLGAVKERSEFPNYTAELAYAMTEETRRLVADLVWNNRNFMELFSSQESFVSSSLAKLYGVPMPKAEYDAVAMPAATGRAGVLGHALFLSATSKPSDTSPTQRGLFVREHFLCQEVPQPPPGVNANLPNLTAANPITNRERLAIHLNNESCASCHTLVDPIGFGFENYDAIGQHRAKQKLTFKAAHGEKTETVRVELDIDPKGYVSGLPNSNFTTPAELGRILAAAPQCQQCVAKQLFRYYMGRHESEYDEATLQRAFADFQASGFRLQRLMISLLKWSTFPPQT